MDGNYSTHSPLQQTGTAQVASTDRDKSRTQGNGLLCFWQDNVDFNCSGLCYKLRLAQLPAEHQHKPEFT